MPLAPSFNSDNNNTENVDMIQKVNVSLEDDGATGDPLINKLRKIRKESRDNIIISHVNINSIKHKFDYIHDILSEGLLDVICITETKLDETYSSNLFQLYIQHQAGLHIVYHECSQTYVSHC